MTGMSDDAAPLLRVLDASATPEEVAALVAVISSLAASAPADSRGPVSQWSAHARKVRPVLRHGADAWRASALPR